MVYKFHWLRVVEAALSSLSLRDVCIAFTATVLNWLTLYHLTSPHVYPRRLHTVH